MPNYFGQIAAYSEQFKFDGKIAVFILVTTLFSKPFAQSINLQLKAILSKFAVVNTDIYNERNSI